MKRMQSFLGNPKNYLLLGLLLLLFFLPTDSLFAQDSTEHKEKVNAMLEEFDNFKHPSLITQAVALTFMALMPFIVMILTAFIKIVVVLSLLRSALGAQQAPPNQVLNGVAFLLSLYVMFPTSLKIYDSAYEILNSPNIPGSLFSEGSPEYMLQVAGAAAQPYREFMLRNTLPDHQKTFYRMTFKVVPPEYRTRLKPDDYIVMIPAYIATQLKAAFEVGVLIYIPFFVIDLVTSNVLLAMGMMMLSPVTISMPLKLFLLVMLDGWTLLITGLVSTFK